MAGFGEQIPAGFGSALSIVTDMSPSWRHTVQRLFLAAGPAAVPGRWPSVMPRLFHSYRRFTHGRISAT